MSYMREPVYAYRTQDGVQIYDEAGGELFLDQDVFDALVVMRYAQLATDPDTLEIVEAAAAEQHAGNFGCDALRAKLGLTTGMDAVARVLEEFLPPDQQAEH